MTQRDIEQEKQNQDIEFGFIAFRANIDDHILALKEDGIDISHLVELAYFSGYQSGYSDIYIELERQCEEEKQKERLKKKRKTKAKK